MSVGSKFFCVATRIEFDLLADPGGVSTFYQKFNGFLGVNSPMHAQRTSMNLLSQLLSAGCFNLEQPKRSCGLTLEASKLLTFSDLCHSDPDGRIQILITLFDVPEICSTTRQ